jgi:hypothetical protein
MAIDLLLIVFLTKTGGVVLGLVAAVVLFRAAAPDPRSGFISRYVRTILRFSSAIILAVVIMKGFGKMDRVFSSKDDESDQDADSIAQTAISFTDKVSPRDALKLAGAALKLKSADDSTEIMDAAREILGIAHRDSVDARELYAARSDLVSLLGDNPDSSQIRALDAAYLDVIGEAPPPRPTDSTTSPVNELQREVRTLRASNATLQRRLADSQKEHGFRQFLAGAADDMGVGFGWSAVYFTAFLALWRGQTPGKKVAGVRVLRLDGKPLGWWMSFERFGGYAASFSVGLLGFLQILWDRNRQGLHDKACETVVVKAP